MRGNHEGAKTRRHEGIKAQRAIINKKAVMQMVGFETFSPLKNVIGCRQKQPVNHSATGATVIP